MRHLSWFFFVLGLALGIIFGVYYAWEISPINPKEATIADLDVHFQEEYQTLVALAYANTGNLSRAIRRLDVFPEENTTQSLSSLAQQHLADGRFEEDVLAVAQLAAALSNPTARAVASEDAQGSATPRPSPTMTHTPTPPPTLTPTPMVLYQLRSKEKVCNPALDLPLIQVFVFNSSGVPVPGVEVLVLWDQGQDHFFTGLKPQISPGYGDFAMIEGVTYTVLIPDSVETISGLSAEECIQDDESYSGSWLLTFEEP
jgi:hypothetical protein